MGWVKPFVRYMSYTHVMPARYSIPSDMETKSLVKDAQIMMGTPDSSCDAEKALSVTLKERFTP